MVARLEEFALPVRVRELAQRGAGTIELGTLIRFLRADLQRAEGAVRACLSQSSDPGRATDGTAGAAPGGRRRLRLRGA